MPDSKKRFTGTQRCGHCGNSAPMEVVADHSTVRVYDDPRTGIEWNAGDVYELLTCPACGGITLRSYYWHDMAMDPSEIEFTILYPTRSEAPLGLPEPVARAYEAAQKVRNVDANAYGALLGRVLDEVCADRKTRNGFLGQKIKQLASRGEIPTKLVGVAEGLKDLRNLGAHANLGELTPAELPILDKLCRAILEYVYSAPFLAEEATKRLAQLKDVNPK